MCSISASFPLLDGIVVYLSLLSQSLSLSLFHSLGVACVLSQPRLLCSFDSVMVCLSLLSLSRSRLSSISVSSAPLTVLWKSLVRSLKGAWLLSFPCPIGLFFSLLPAEAGAGCRIAIVVTGASWRRPLHSHASKRRSHLGPAPATLKQRSVIMLS